MAAGGPHVYKLVCFYNHIERNNQEKMLKSFKFIDIKFQYVNNGTEQKGTENGKKLKDLELVRGCSE